MKTMNKKKLCWCGGHAGGDNVLRRDGGSAGGDACQKPFPTGDAAHSKYFSDNVYEKIAGPKEEIVVPGATHVDLYDRMDKIPFDRLIAFFDNNLK